MIKVNVHTSIHLINSIVGQIRNVYPFYDFTILVLLNFDVLEYTAANKGIAAIGV